MTSIATAAAQIRASPALVLIVDTCNFLDLFRGGDGSKRKLLPEEEIQTAAALLALVAVNPLAVHLIVPELIPIEFADNADKVAGGFESWIKNHDMNQHWLVESAFSVAVALPQPMEVFPLDLHLRFRKLAEDLLARATVLDRDQQCLERAVARLIAKHRPSHEKEIKDSMNLEQSLELSRMLATNPALPYPQIFVSSNTNDFAKPNTTKMHPDLQAEFDAASLTYSTSLREAVGSLRAQGLL